MKTVTVAYLLSNEYNNPKHFKQRFLIENEQDIQHAQDSKIIGVLHKAGIRKILAEGDRVILNESGGYCGTKGTWQIIPDDATVHRALDAMLKGKSFRMRMNERKDWKENGSQLTSTWFVITAIHSDKAIDVCGNNHDVFENIYMDSLIGL